MVQQTELEFVELARIVAAGLTVALERCGQGHRGHEMYDHVEIVAVGFPQPLESFLRFFDGVGVLTEFDQRIGAHDVDRGCPIVEAEQTRAQVTTADPVLELIEAGQ